jgi:hypothetical protein
MIKKSSFSHLVAGASLALLSLAASAQHEWGDGRTATPGIDRAQAQQARQIERGVRTGLLTRQEARQLWREQSRIALVKQRAMQDGSIDRAERQRLHAMQAHAEQAIAHQMRDAQHTPRRRG